MESAGDALKSWRKVLNVAGHSGYLSVCCNIVRDHLDDATTVWALVCTYTIAPHSPRAPSTGEAPSLQVVMKK